MFVYVPYAFHLTVYAVDRADSRSSDASKFTLAANGIFKLLDARPVVDVDSTEGIKPAAETTEGHIKLEDVHFRYSSRPNVPVLRGLSLEVKPGAFIALVGPSGCGKCVTSLSWVALKRKPHNSHRSTVISLLERFYDPLAGQITLDGADVKTLNVGAYRSQIALVAQESALYSGSARTNVALGSDLPQDQVTQEMIEDACKSAKCVRPSGFEMRS